MGGVSWYKLVVHILLAATRRTYFCKSIAIEMGGVSPYFSKVSGSGLDSTLLMLLGAHHWLRSRIVSGLAIATCHNKFDRKNYWNKKTVLVSDDLRSRSHISGFPIADRSPSGVPLECYNWSRGQNVAITIASSTTWYCALRLNPPPDFQQPKNENIWDLHQRCPLTTHMWGSWTTSDCLWTNQPLEMAPIMYHLSTSRLCRDPCKSDAKMRRWNHPCLPSLLSLSSSSSSSSSAAYCLIAL